jgi:predicted enzyme related to lactoylglutathione lyase
VLFVSVNDARAGKTKETLMSNKVDYFEIGTPDAEASRTFYAQLFGWEIASESSEAGYRMVNDGQGGLWDTSSIGAANWAIFYVHVDDVAESVRLAESLGAEVAIPLTAGGGIEFAHLKDPQGNRFGVGRPTP